MNKQKKKNIDKYKTGDPNILLEIYRKIFSAPRNYEESIVEDQAILGELYRVGAITCGEYIELLGMCYD